MRMGCWGLVAVGGAAVTIVTPQPQPSPPPAPPQPHHSPPGSPGQASTCSTCHTGAWTCCRRLGGQRGQHPRCEGGRRTWGTLSPPPLISCIPGKFLGCSRVTPKPRGLWPPWLRPTQTRDTSGSQMGRSQGGRKIWGDLQPPPPALVHVPMGVGPPPHAPLTTSATLQWGSMLPMCLGCAGLVLPSKSSAGGHKGGQ